MNAYQNKHEGSLPFKIGDFVCIVDIEIAKFRNANVLDDYLPYERKLKTLFENVNRIGEVTSLKK